MRSVRAQPPIILAPRDTRVLPGAVAFEWPGSDRLTYQVRLRGPQGAVVWERADLGRRPLAYPASAPKLTPGARYTWELGLLFQESLYADARRELVAAIAAAPEEATLHLLLGQVYDRTGLRSLAADEFDEAEALAAPRP